MHCQKQNAIEHTPTETIWHSATKIQENMLRGKQLIFQENTEASPVILRNSNLLRLVSQNGNQKRYWQPCPLQTLQVGDHLNN
jgi:hypothetical protein